MKATVLYKIASVLLILFAAGHTFGFLSFNPPSAEGRAVYDSMNNVHFKVKGSIFSYGGFYRGFGLSINREYAFLCVSGLVSWRFSWQESRENCRVGLGVVRRPSGVTDSKLDLFFGSPGDVFRNRGSVPGLGGMAGNRSLARTLPAPFMLIKHNSV